MTARPSKNLQSADQDAAPIGIFAYDRPDHLRVTLQALERCDGFARHPVTFYLDHPSRPEAEAAVAATRAVAREFAGRWGATVVERPANLRFRNITEGVTELCDRHGEAILVEDDIVVSPDFLAYMRAALEAYRDEPRLWSVSGFAPPGAFPAQPAFRFLQGPSVWGWATWKRAWDHYSWEPEGWQAVMDDPARRRRYDYEGTADMGKALTEIMQGHHNWDHQWTFAHFQHDALSLWPARSLVWNCGTRSGVHWGGQRAPETRPVDRAVHGRQRMADFASPRLPPGWRLPDAVAPDPGAYACMVRFNRRVRRWRRVDWLRKDAARLARRLRSRLQS